ncbi:MAG: SDR family NAD(P)-dependent oxidoreductase [Lutibacter sp.]|uniref:SDR family NAD(P)-dependent oxidoreductase n=1 Tax=Lutibacter sp. TaxID=1925666 RepID=UPI0017FF76F5|nr:SDR family NAD(P)-dependent oxidoreductase [Lutibacter sp.]MBT8317359.1 SDR family NAD(P)-dependent oxidoreductase [Lutibacter sp.]NNJ58218.1 SDR family NAD(P)-dependent oxidoreductase [Lutibacter sp.]
MKNALIIGATSGIGKELAKLLVADNYKVVITGRRKKLLQEIKNLNPNNYIIKVHDVTNIDSCETLFKEVKEELETIDLLVYSSGVGEPNYKLEWEVELPTLQTNIIAATKIYGLAYNLFRKQGFGHLVGISSIASIRGNRHVPAYFASKAFQANYLESLWLKGKRSKSNIVVTDIQPGFVDTSMALGKTFWMSTTEKATKQIYTAIKRKKKKAYITKRWRLIAMILKIVPSSLLHKFL